MDKIITKFCSKCGEEKTADNFPYKNWNKNKCSACKRAEAKQWRKNNPDKVAVYCDNNREQMRASKANWKKNNPNYNKEYAATHRDKMNELNRQWRKNNKDKYCAGVVKWKLEYPNKAAEYTKRWRERHPEKALVDRHKAKAKRTGAEGSFTPSEWESLCNKNDNKCLCCGAQTKMTPDHVVPLARGGTNYIDNIQPLCLPCNMKKGIKTIDYRV